MHQSERGYSLVEMLVVVAIIGIVSLVTVPNFIAMQRSAKMKSSLRQLMTDIRGVRQYAISKNRPTMLSFGLGGTARDYRIYEQVIDSTGTPVWQLVPTNARRQLESSVYFETTNMPNTVNSDLLNWNDLIFSPNGTVRNIPTGLTNGTVRIKTDFDIPTRQFTVSIWSTGRMTTS